MSIFEQNLRAGIGDLVRRRRSSEAWKSQIVAGTLDIAVPVPGLDHRNVGFSIAARKLATRDRFIGRTPELWERNLPIVIDNPRFLILPWIVILNLGSHILSLVRRQPSDNWTDRFYVPPALIETFVETARFAGALYKASGRTRVGTI